MKENKKINKNFMGVNNTLLVDEYELTMLQGYFLCKKEPMVVFDMFYRSNPSGNGYAVAAGLECVIEYIQNLHFGEEEIEVLAKKGIYCEEFLDYLRNFKFTGTLYAVEEGTVVFPMEPLLRVEAPITQAQYIETALLNFINHQSLIATKASRVCQAAEGEAVMEFGLRRAQGPDAGTIGARAAVIGGCAITSNVLCAQRYGIPTSGTHAHSWVMSFKTELEAFMAYVNVYPTNAILLVDTYDTLKSGVPNAIKAFQKLRAEGKLTGRYGIRLDSGDLAYLSKKARKMLDDAGFHDAIISASNDLDENLITNLKSQGAKITLWGVGTNLITSKDCPAFGGVYKLAAIQDEETGKYIAKIKVSENTVKITNPGKKKVYRIIDKDTNKFLADLICLDHEVIDTTKDLEIFDQVDTWKKTNFKAGTYRLEELLVPIFVDGEYVYEEPTIDEIIKRCKEQKDCLWEEVKRLSNPHKYYVDLSEELYTEKQRLLHLAKKEVKEL